MIFNKSKTTSSVYTLRMSRRVLLHHALPALGLIVLTLLIYSNAVYNPFVIDDHDVIVSHPHVVEPGGFTELWISDYWAGRSADPNLYRPLIILSYHINHALTGLSPGAFRIINMLILAAVAMCIAWRSSHTISLFTAWLVAIVVIVHPLNVEAINHIVGRADLMSLLGVLVFMLVHQRAITLGRWSPWLATLGAAGVLLAVGTKESGMIVLPVAAAQLYIGRGKSKQPVTGGAGVSPVQIQQDSNPRESISPLRCDDRRDACPTRTRHFVVTTTLVVGVPLVIYLALRFAAVGVLPSYAGADPAMDLTNNPLRDLSFIERLPGAFALHWHYLVQMFLPNTAWNHTPAKPPSFGQLDVWLGLVTLLVVVASTAWLLWRRHWLALAGVILLSHFLIVGQLLFPTGVYAANRLTMPFVTAMALALGALLQLASDHLGKTARWVMALVVVAALLGAAVVVESNAMWQDHVTRMTTDAQRSPDQAVTQYLAGAALMNPESGNPVTQADVQQAVGYFQRSLALHPDSNEATISLANAQAMRGRFDQALSLYQQVQARLPDNVKVLMGVAYTAALLGDEATARDALKQLEQRDDLTPSQKADMAKIQALLQSDR